PVEPDDHRRQGALLPRPAGQRGVAARQEDQVAQVGAVQAARRSVLQDDQGEGAAAAGGTVASSGGLVDDKSDGEGGGCAGRRHGGFLSLPAADASWPRATG